MTQSTSHNRILRSLPAGDLEALHPDLHAISLRMKQVLNEPGEDLAFVYFLEGGVVSMLTVLEDGTAVEIATVGNEGMVDVASFLGLARSESRLLVQIPGTALRMPVAAFRSHVASRPALRTAVGLYVMELFTLVAQQSACNRIHPVTERCARWVLMTHDRVDADEFPLTHEFLSEMLGIRRPSVTVAVGVLREAGLIDYRRGRLKILDRDGLEAAACECYALIRARFDRLPGAVAGAGRLLSSGLRATSPNAR